LFVVAAHGKISTTDQGCQIFLGATYQNVEKYTQMVEIIPIGHKIYQMGGK
jgi:hypothetical protein